MDWQLMKYPSVGLQVDSVANCPWSVLTMTIGGRAQGLAAGTGRLLGIYVTTY